MIRALSHPPPPPCGCGWFGPGSSGWVIRHVCLTMTLSNYFKSADVRVCCCCLVVSTNQSVPPSPVVWNFMRMY